MHIEFKTIDNDYKTFVLEDEEKYILLSYFLSTFRSSDLTEFIEMFEEVETGKKTFEEVWNPNVYLSFGNGSGYIELDKTTAYFFSFSPKTERNFEMPLKELIDIMKRWKAFLGV